MVSGMIVAKVIHKAPLRAVPQQKPKRMTQRRGDTPTLGPTSSNLVGIRRGEWVFDLTSAMVVACCLDRVAAVSRVV
jgi:hypothetical protein